MLGSAKESKTARGSTHSHELDRSVSPAALKNSGLSDHAHRHWLLNRQLTHGKPREPASLHSYFSGRVHDVSRAITVTLERSAGLEPVFCSLEGYGAALTPRPQVWWVRSESNAHFSLKRGGFFLLNYEPDLAPE